VGTQDDAEVISMSFGGFSYDEGFYDAVKKAYDAGIVLVAAAGNEGEEGVTYPAKFREVIAVAAIDENDNVASWSSKGPEVELAAPGVNVLSTVPNNRYAYLFWHVYGLSTCLRNCRTNDLEDIKQQRNLYD